MLIGASAVIHKTYPRIIDEYDDSKYIMAKCKCPKDTRYVLAVNINDLTLDEKTSEVCHMYCPLCDTNIIVGFKGEIE